MMEKSSTLSMRIEPHLKAQAEAILRKNGLSSAQAIRIFYSQICMHQGLPFEIKIPNALSKLAMEELESGKGETYPNMKAVWGSLEDEH
jgi:DNA-damage-inducible protein J